MSKRITPCGFKKCDAHDPKDPIGCTFYEDAEAMLYCEFYKPDPTERLYETLDCIPAKEDK